ncbi:MAG: hypothetical protein WCW26_00925 [Candidatus Buchananbacteria bacterium]
MNEVRTGIRAYSELNSPTAIPLGEVKKALKDNGKKNLAVTVPAFGQPDLWNGGAILSNDPAIRLRSRDLIYEGAEMCLNLLEEGLGEGVFIWWPATDSLRYPHTEYDLRSGRERLINYWAEVLTKYPKLRIWLEWKPADPGDRDYFAYYKEAIAFAWAVNYLVGRVAVLLNFEFAHASICGDNVEEVTAAILEPATVLNIVDVLREYLGIEIDNVPLAQMISTATLVDLIVHVNSSVNKGPDQDKRVGAVNNEETQGAIKRLDACPQRVIAEHDIKCLDGKPIAYYEQSVAALEEMRVA